MAGRCLPGAVAPVSQAVWTVLCTHVDRRVYLQSRLTSGWRKSLGECRRQTKHRAAACENVERQLVLTSRFKDRSSGFVSKAQDETIYE